jgi:hypothetical protein
LEKVVPFVALLIRAAAYLASTIRAAGYELAVAANDGCGVYDGMTGCHDAKLPPADVVTGIRANPIIALFDHLGVAL